MYDEISGWQLILYSVLLQTIVHILTPFYAQEIQEILPLIIIIWFSVNILLSFWFVRQTVKFLSLKKQMHNINRYIINYLPKYIKAILLRKDCKSQNNSSSNKKFKDNSEDSVPNVDQIIIMLFHQLEDALKDNNESSFENAIDKFINYYREIESSMYFINDNNEADNWLLLSKTFYSKNILDIFTEQFRDISQQVVNKIASNVNFFKAWCVFYIKLFNIHSKDKSQLNPQIIKQYINNNYYCWHTLMLSTAGYNLSDRIIDSAIKIYIGYWERYNKIIRVDDERSITDINFSIIQKHLECTSLMVISALKNNNQEATKWAIDALVYWHKNFFIEYQHEYYNWQNEIVTPELFLDPEKLVANSTSNADNLKKDINQLKDIITKIEDKKSIAFFNYWIDIKLLTATYIMSCRDIKDSKDQIDRLLNNDRLEANTTDIYEGKISNVDELLNAYLRQSNLWREDDCFYDNIFSNHLDNLARIEQPEWIIGRGYSGTGTAKDRYLISFYQIIGIGLTTSEFSFDTWRQLLEAENIPDYYFPNIKEALKQLTNINDEIIAKVCEYFDIDKIEAKNKAEIFKNSIDKFREKSQDKINETIKNATIDDKKVTKLELGASKDSFTIENGPLPINLFKDIEYTKDFTKDLGEKKFNNFHKIDICKEKIPGKATLQDDFLKSDVAEQVTIKCFEQLDKIKWQEKAFTNHLKLLEKAVEDSQNIKQPIMFISSLELWQLLDLNKYKLATTEQKLPFNIVTETGRGDFYICHVEDIAVYKYPYKNDNFSILVSQEIFKKITIKKFDENRYVTFKYPEKDAITGDLRVEFGIDCKFDAKLYGSAFKYSTDESES